jgi:GR25 family glycosyltransferase involved in LPS biosynthesis
MIISKDKQFIFIHIPKNSGTEMTNNIQKVYNNCEKIDKVDKTNGIDKMHLYLDVISQYIDKDIFKNYIKFCIIRNPYYKIFSAWNYLKERYEYNNVNDFIKYKLNEEFIYGFELIPGDARVHYRPQYTFIYDNNEKKNVDFIIRYEYLNEDINLFNEKYNLNIPLYGNNSHKDYLKYFNNESIHKINILYKKDFELLNYEMINSNIDTYFDKIYIINLDKDVKRKSNMISQMVKHNIHNYVFQKATSGIDIDKNEYIKNKEWAYPGNNFCNINNNCSCSGKGYELSVNEIALHLSHYHIWKDIVKNNYQKCLILEDDCIFTENINTFNNIISNIPNNWELLYLGHSKKINGSYGNNSIIINSDFNKLLYGINETHIYAITNDCANILINNMLPIRAAVDGYLGHFMVTKKVLSNVFVSRNDYGINGSLYGMMPSTMSVSNNIINNNTDKVSVIIPTYNRFQYLLNAIESVQKQSYKNIEIIVINDCSTDKQYYNHEWNDIIMIHLQKNSKDIFGYGCAGYVRNQGLKVATGKYIAFCDDDDIWFPNKLEIQLKAMKENNCSMSSTDGFHDVGEYNDNKSYKKMNAEVHYNTLQSIYKHKNSKLLENGFPKIWDYQFLQIHNCMITSSVIIEKKILDLINNFKNMRPPGEDYECWMRALQFTDSVYVEDVCFYYNAENYIN